MKSLSRTSVYWLAIDKDIERTCRECLDCDRYRNKLPKPKNHPWETETRPWARIHIDHAVNFLGSNWLVVIDSFSKFPFVHKTSTTSASSTIRFLEENFNIFDYPEVIVSGNTTSFSSSEFKNWCNDHEFLCVNSSAYHPSTIGIAERFVQTLKRGLQKFRGNLDKGLQEVWLQFRRTLASCGRSPSQLMMGTIIRCTLIPFVKQDPNIVRKSYSQRDTGSFKKVTIATSVMKEKRMIDLHIEFRLKYLKI